MSGHTGWIRRSAARKFEQKVAKFLKTPKDYFKPILKSQKTYIKGFPKVKNIKALKIMLKTGLNQAWANPEKFSAKPGKYG